MDAYKIAVSLAMSSNGPQVLQALAAQILHVHAKVSQLQGTLNKVQLAIGGAFAVAGGLKILGAYGKLVEHGEKLVHYQTQLRAAGYDNLKIAEATNAAYETGRKVLTSRYDENLRDIHHIADVTGDIDEAMKLSSVFAEVKQVLMSLKDDKMRSHYEGAEGQTLALARALESMGVMQKGPEEVTDWVQSITDAMISMRGQVDGSNFLSTIQNAGGYQRFWSKDFVAGVLPPLINEMKRPVGNALYMMERGLYQGRITKGGAEGLEKYGFIRGGEDYQTDAAGRYLGLKPGAVKGADEFLGPGGNPYKWVTDVFIPQMASKGITDEKGLLKAASEIALNKSFFNVLTLFITQQKMINKEVENWRRVQEHGGSKFLNDDPSIVKKAFFSQWKNLLIALGSPQVAPAYDALKKITIGLADMAKAITKMEPEKLRLIGDGIFALGAGLGGAGAIALLAALGPAGWLVGAIAGLATLAWMNRDFGAWLKSNSISDAINTWMESNSLSDWVTTWLSAGADGIKTWLKSNSIVDWITSKLPSIPSSPSPLAPGDTGIDGIPSQPLQKQSFSVGPPPNGEKKIQLTTIFQADGRTLSRMVTDHQVRDGNGPAQGSPYPDTTRGGSTFDFALA